MNLHSIAKSTLISALCFGLAAVADADSDPWHEDGYEPVGFEVSFIYADWTTNNQLTTPLETLRPYAGSFWTTFGFIRKGENSKPQSGDKVYPMTAKVRSINPLEKNYTKAVIHISFDHIDWRSQYDHTVGLLVSSNPVFSNDDGYDLSPSESDEYDCPGYMKASAEGEYFIFDIPHRDTEDYYQFYIDIPAGGPRDEWLNLYEMFFFHTEESVIMEYNQSKKICTVVALKGDLHVRGYEYDMNGNLVNSDITKAPGDVQHDWTNQVALQEIPYTVAAPVSTGNYIDLFAKAVNEGEHSPEKYMRIFSDGTATEINDIPTDMFSTPSETEWYDLMGRKLSEPIKGVMIKKEGAKTSKVIIR